MLPNFEKILGDIKWEKQLPEQNCINNIYLKSWTPETA